MVHLETAIQAHSDDKGRTSDLMIFAVSFVVLLALALTGSLLGWHWRTWLPGAEGAKSIFSGVKAGVYTFMSHIL